MIKKIFLLLLFCLVFASSAFATTQYYYLRTTGAGSNSGDTGTWFAVPTSDAHAMSASNFNDSGNWSATDDANKLDPDDVVYAKGSWGSGYSLTINSGITLDMYESGDYDPEVDSHAIDPVFHSAIYIKSNDVTIQDGRFDYAARAIIAEDALVKFQRIKILRNFFNISRYHQWVAIFFGFVCDSEVGYNSFEGIPHSMCGSGLEVYDYMGMPLVLNAGSRNKIHHNFMRGGWLGIAISGSRTWDYDLYTVDYPGSGSYTADPDINLEDNEISYNYIGWRCQEGISYDVPGSPGVTQTCSIIERDTIASVSGTAVTLNNAGGEWTGKGNLYSGYYMVALANRDNTFGNHALIEYQSDNSFTLSNEILNLAVGDTVVIGMAFRHNWIHHNTFGDRGFGGSSILLGGMALENLIEYNELPRKDSTEGMGITVGSLDGYVIAYNSVTQTYASQPCAYNIVRNNICGGVWNYTYDKNYGPGADFTTRNNAIYNNTIYTDDYYPRYTNITRANAFVVDSGNLWLGSTGSLRATDPTGYVAAYFANWGPPLAPLRPPQNITVK